MGKNYKSKADNKNFNSIFQFCLGNLFEKSDVIGCKKASFKGNDKDFSVG